MADKSNPGLNENLSRTIGREAQRNNILAAKILADVVKTTLGPKGMDKMLVDSTGNVTITNDGVTILEEMELDHPAAKMIVEVARTQEKEVGDGTTTVALLAGKLLEYAERLLDKRVHPTTIIRGYRAAAAHAQSTLTKIASPTLSKETLKQIAMTAMTGKGVEGNREHLSNLIVQAIEHVAENKTVDLSDVRIVKVLGESSESSQLITGLILEKEAAHASMPHSIAQAKISLVDFPIELKRPETETRLSLSTPEQYEQFIATEERLIRELVTKIIHSQANVVLCQKGIDDVAQYYLAEAGIYAVRRLPRSDMEKLARATGARIISNVSELSQDSLGYASLVEQRTLNQEKYTFITGCKNPKSVSLLIRGNTTHTIDETERAISDGLGVVASAVREGFVVAGGGAVEAELTHKLREFAKTQSGKDQLAIEEFAATLESIPEALAENAGLDPITILTELRKYHASNNPHYGLNLFTEKVENTLAAGIVEPVKVKSQAINAATEVACTILRIDDVLVASDPKQPKNIDYRDLD